MATSKPAATGRDWSAREGRSVRVKLLLLVAGVALLVGLISAGFQLIMNRQLLREQMVKRGRYIAQNLAYNAKYGVLTEDKHAAEPAPRPARCPRGRRARRRPRTSWAR